MSTATVACPNCHSPLRSATPIPAGARVKCPRCAASFTVPGAPAAVMARPAGNGPAPPVAVAAGPPPLARPATALPASSPDVARPKRSIALPVMLGVGGLLGVGLLAFWLFSGGSPKKTDDDRNNDPPPVAQRPAPPKKAAAKPLIVLNAREEKTVREVTHKGIEFLKKAQDKTGNGSWGGPGGGHPVGATAMAGLTLLECGVSPKDVSIRNAAFYLRNAAPTLNMTYDLALAVLFFNRLGDPEDRYWVQKLAVRLAAGQSGPGGWTYTCPVLNAEDHYRFLAALNELQRTPARRLPDVQAKLRDSLPDNLKRLNLAVLQNNGKKDANFYRDGGDNSNTQFALLALWAARKHDLPLKPTLDLVARRFALSQDSRDGQWHYAGMNNVSGNPTMTCAGLLGMAVHHGVQEAGGGKRVTPKNDPIIQKALSVVAANINHATKNNITNHEMYYLWSVERVAVLFQLRKIGEEDWYHWGMDRLVKQQRQDGGWAGAGYSNDVVDTCFALLFLQRINLAEDLTDKLRELEALVGRSDASAGRD
jgi:hypothetical protein